VLVGHGTSYRFPKRRRQFLTTAANTRIIISAPTRRLSDAPGLATDSQGGLTMTDSQNITNLRGFPPWRVITHKEMKRCRLKPKP
jgi:hypothetical protein